MDAKDWAGVRDRPVAALAVDGLFVPALLLIRALRLARPSMFKQGDITDDDAERRVEGTSIEAKKHDKRFVESLASSPPSQPSSTSGSRMFLVGHWKHWIEKDLVEAVKWYHKAAEQGNIIAQKQLECENNTSTSIGFCLQGRVNEKRPHAQRNEEKSIKGDKCATVQVCPFVFVFAFSLTIVLLNVTGFSGSDTFLFPCTNLPCQLSFEALHDSVPIATH
jgi:hypothetical protein